MGLIQFGSNGIEAAAAAMIPLQPPAASTIAGGVDQLYYLLTGITLFFTVLIFSIIFYFMVKYRRRSEDEKAARRALIRWCSSWPGRLSLRSSASSCSSGLRASICAAYASARGFDGNFRDRQAVDVAPAASGGAARNQRAARAGGRSGQADDDFAGRDSRFLHSRVSRQEGCAAGPLHFALV